MKEICPNLRNKQVAKEFGELEQLFGKTAASLLWSRNNGYSIDKAPNGADSILFQSLLDITKNRQQALIEKAKIYSDNFLKWFGDWEKAANANRVSLGKEIPNTDEYSKCGQKGETDVEIREVLDEKGNVIGTVRMEFSGKNRKEVVTLHPNLTVTGKGYGTALYQHIADKYNINIEESFGEIGKSEAAKRMWNRIYNAISKDPDTPLRQLTPSNSSKVVDENGEPLVVYSGRPTKGTTIFNLNSKRNRTTLTSLVKKGVYFTKDKEIAEKYSGSSAYENEIDKDIMKYGFADDGGAFSISKEEFLDIYPNVTPEYYDNMVERYNQVVNDPNNPIGGFHPSKIKIEGEVISAFLNIKNPVIIDMKGSTIAHLSKNQKQQINNSEGAIIENVNEAPSGVMSSITSTTTYILFDSNQIKSATDNIGTFDANNPDIRFMKADTFKQDLLVDDIER